MEHLYYSTKKLYGDYDFHLPERFNPDLGTITGEGEIKNSGTIEVASAQNLEQALHLGGTTKLIGTVTLTRKIESYATSAILDVAGFTLNCDSYAIVVEGGAAYALEGSNISTTNVSLTIKDSSTGKSGKITGTGHTGYGVVAVQGTADENGAYTSTLINSVPVQATGSSCYALSVWSDGQSGVATIKNSATAFGNNVASTGNYDVLVEGNGDWTDGNTPYTTSVTDGRSVYEYSLN